jgi:hypothetical protein
MQDPVVCFNSRGAVVAMMCRITSHFLSHFYIHCWQQVVFLWKRGIGNMFSSCFLREHQRNGIRAYQKRKARSLFSRETLAKHVSLMLFPWETGLGASSVHQSIHHLWDFERVVASKTL